MITGGVGVGADAGKGTGGSIGNVYPPENLINLVANSHRAVTVAQERVVVVPEVPQGSTLVDPRQYRGEQPTLPLEAMLSEEISEV